MNQFGNVDPGFHDSPALCFFMTVQFRSSAPTPCESFCDVVSSRRQFRWFAENRTYFAQRSEVSNRGTGSWTRLGSDPIAIGQWIGSTPHRVESSELPYAKGSRRVRGTK